jgi:hypothetical protein
VAAVNTGNSVHRSNRYQLVFDGLATVCERYLVDRRRVYVAGVSGGGKISTHLWACFPDVFTGSVPIVGLATYTSVPAGPGKVWPQDFGKPTPKLFRQIGGHRLGAMTGDEDFNQKPISETAKVLVRDGLEVRVFDYPGMGHTLPTAERFTEAIKWVDEPYTALRDAEEKAASGAFSKVEGLTGMVREEALAEVTRAGPWTDAAWKAATMLLK